MQKLLTVDTTVRSVSSSAQSWCLVDLNVFDDKSVNIQTLQVSVALCVLKQLKQEFSRFLGPATFKTNQNTNLLYNFIYNINNWNVKIVNKKFCNFSVWESTAPTCGKKHKASMGYVLILISLIFLSILQFIKEHFCIVRDVLFINMIIMFFESLFTLSCAELFSLSASTNATVKPSEWNTLFVFRDILKVFLSPPQVHTFDSTGSFMSVLKKI